MMQLYRVLPMVLSVGLFGCGNSATQENANATGTPATETKDSFVSKLPDTAPVFKVATTGVTPPFSFQDDYGNMQGIDIDAIRAIGETQGFKVEFYKEPWVELFDSVESGSRDMALAGISYKPERDAKYGLSDSYFFNPSALMYKNTNLNIQKLEDIKGLKVGGMEGGKSIGQVIEVGGYSELVSDQTPFLLFEQLVQGKVDVIANDSIIWRYIAKGHPDSKVTIVPYETESDPAAQQVILMAKGNTKLINNINEGITKLKAKGTFEEIEARWLGEDTSTDTSAADTNTKQLN